MNHHFRQQLKNGQLLIGTMLTLNSPEVAEILTHVGFDWLFLDAEHSPHQAASLQRILQAVSPAMPCLIRLPISEEVPIKKALDIGATGIIAPMINSAKQAQNVVNLCKYAPLGSRGVGLGRAHGYGLSVQQYLKNANQEVTVVIQAEHIKAVENIEAIVKVEGIDAVFIGPYDLSASLGRLGEVEHPEVMAAINHVTEVCQQANIALGAFGISAQAVKPYIENGYTLITVGVDTLLLGNAAKQLLADVKHN